VSACVPKVHRDPAVEKHWPSLLSIPTNQCSMADSAIRSIKETINVLDLRIFSNESPLLKIHITVENEE